MKLTKFSGTVLLGCAAGLILVTAVMAEKPALKDPVAHIQKNRPKGVSKKDIDKLKVARTKGASAAKRQFPKEKKSPAADMILGKDEVAKNKKLKGEKARRAAHSKLVKSEKGKRNLAKARKVGRGKPKNAKPGDKKPW